MADRMAIVTGASSGIGLAVARALVDNKWTVLGIARREASLTNAGYHHIRFDLATIGSASNVLRDALATLLRQSSSRVGLVNNAALVGPLGSIVDVDPVEVARVYAVNAVAPLWLIGEVVRLSPPKAAVRIVNVSSGAATGAYPGLGVYSMSKAALRMAGMSLASEWGSRESREHKRADAAILSYEPGIVDTDMQRAARELPVETFPWDMFRGFARDRALVSPDRPAGEIVKFLESERQPHFSERRLP